MIELKSRQEIVEHTGRMMLYGVIPKGCMGAKTMGCMGQNLWSVWGQTYELYGAKHMSCMGPNL